MCKYLSDSEFEVVYESAAASQKPYGSDEVAHIVALESKAWRILEAAKARYKADQSYQLTVDAKDEIHAAGLTIAAYVRFTFPDGQWGGDECGCTDDRCIGFHHERRDECQCLPVLLGYAVASQRGQS
jgi:hypothetical protein